MTENVIDLEAKETQLRADRAMKLAKSAYHEVRRQCKILRAQGEKEPHLLEQMALAYANALSHYATYESLKDTGYTWDHVKENAYALIEITFDHIERRFMPELVKLREESKNN